MPLLRSLHAPTRAALHVPTSAAPLSTALALCHPQVRAAFEAGCDGFRKGGFSFGDPHEYLHEPGHPHCTRPDYLNCQACKPPVQGRVLLLYRQGDEVVETWGANEAPTVATRSLSGSLSEAAVAYRQFVSGRRRA